MWSGLQWSTEAKFFSSIMTGVMVFTHSFIAEGWRTTSPWWVQEHPIHYKSLDILLCPLCQWISSCCTYCFVFRVLLLKSATTLFHLRLVSRQCQEQTISKPVREYLLWVCALTVQAYVLKTIIPRNNHKSLHLWGILQINPSLFVQTMTHSKTKSSWTHMPTHMFKPFAATYKHKMAHKQTAIGQWKSGNLHLLDTPNTNIHLVAAAPSPTQFCTMNPNVTVLSHCSGFQQCRV